MEMRCHCDSNYHDDSYCDNLIPFKHHKDWNNDEDYICEECLCHCKEDDLC